MASPPLPAGWLKKKASGGLLKSWQPRWFVLYRNSMEMRYYGNRVDSRFGAMPLDERGAPAASIVRIHPTQVAAQPPPSACALSPHPLPPLWPLSSCAGSIPIEFVLDVRVPEYDNPGRCRFDVITSKIGDAAYPRDGQAAPTGVGATVTQARVYSLEAKSDADQQLWVRELRALRALMMEMRARATGMPMPSAGLGAAVTVPSAIPHVAMRTATMAAVDAAAVAAGTSASGSVYSFASPPAAGGGGGGSYSSMAAAGGYGSYGGFAAGGGGSGGGSTSGALDSGRRLSSSVAAATASDEYDASAPSPAYDASGTGVAGASMAAGVTAPAAGMALGHRDVRMGSSFPLSAAGGTGVGDTAAVHDVGIAGGGAAARQRRVASAGVDAGVGGAGVGGGIGGGY